MVGAYGIARQQWRARIETVLGVRHRIGVGLHRPPAMAGAD